MKKLFLYQASLILLTASLHASEGPQANDNQQPSIELSTTLGNWWQQGPSVNIPLLAPLAIAAGCGLYYFTGYAGVGCLLTGIMGYKGHEIYGGPTSNSVRVENNKVDSSTQHTTALGRLKFVAGAFEKVGLQIAEKIHSDKDGAVEGAIRAVNQPMAKVIKEELEPMMHDLKTDLNALKQKSVPFVDSLKQMRATLKTVLWVGAGTLAVGVAAWGGMKLYERYLNKPELDFKFLKANKSGGKIGQNHFKDMVFAPAVNAHLRKVLDMTQSVKHKVHDGDELATYRNMLLYGPHGTGKRTFAHLLAQHAHMDFYEISGSALTTFKEGDAARAIDNFFKSRDQKDSHPAVVYIDNAYPLFPGQHTENATHTKHLLDSFVSLAAKRSNNYMIVLSMPFAPHLAGEMASVIDDVIEIQHPAFQERVELLQRCKEKMLLMDNDIDASFAESVNVHLSDEKIEEIAAKFEGVTPRDICACINTIKIEAQLPSEGAVSPALVDRIVNHAVAKHSIISP